MNLDSEHVRKLLALLANGCSYTCVPFFSRWSCLSELCSGQSKDLPRQSTTTYIHTYICVMTAGVMWGHSLTFSSSLSISQRRPCCWALQEKESSKRISNGIASCTKLSGRSSYRDQRHSQCTLQSDYRTRRHTADIAAETTPTY